jgi:hypothetical protein
MIHRNDIHDQGKPMDERSQIQPGQRYIAPINGRECEVETLSTRDGLTWLCCRIEGTDTAVVLAGSQLKPVDNVKVLWDDCISEELSVLDRFGHIPSVWPNN